VAGVGAEEALEIGLRRIFLKRFTALYSARFRALFSDDIVTLMDVSCNGFSYE
jgi:hypothetical protein